MSIYKGRIERRLFDAVLVVLASAGCQPAPAGPVGPAEPPRGPDPWQTSQFATPPADDGVRDPAPNAGAVATLDPRQLCSAYKRAPLGAKDQASWDPALGIASCSFRMRTEQTTTRVSYTPHCCPQGLPRGQRCPGPQMTEVPAARHLTEHVELRADGTVVSSERTWSPVVAAFEEERRHTCGRRPEGLEHTGDGIACSDSVGVELALMAELEAASVPAFDRLARELAAYGAPADLVRRARQAMRDEVRHARMMTALAARHGAVPRAIHVPDLPCRTLDAIARENVIEGCVREAYGALVATYQAERAVPALRAAFEAIARDERRHAALSEDVHAWIVTQLSAGARATIDEARSRAEAELRASLALTTACVELGLPARADAVALFDAYFCSHAATRPLGTHVTERIGA